MGEENNSKNKVKVKRVTKLSNLLGPGPSLTSSILSSRPASTTRPSRIASSSRPSRDLDLDSIFSAPYASFTSLENEEEIQVIDPDSVYELVRPVEFKFPTLKKGGRDYSKLAENISTTEAAKRLLIDQKAKFTSLRRSKQRRDAVDFSPAVKRDNEEDHSSLESLENPNESRPEIDDQQYQNQSSEDADVSEADSK